MPRRGKSVWVAAAWACIYMRARVYVFAYTAHFIYPDFSPLDNHLPIVLAAEYSLRCLAFLRHRSVRSVAPATRPRIFMHS